MQVDPVRQQVLYDALARHITEHFYHPDLEALRIVLSAVHAHYSKGDPVWLFVIGVPGSGKTTIAINCIADLPNVTVESALTSKSFISGKAIKSKSALLSSKSVIVAFKDFTSIISTREDTQREIIGNLREIYDGNFKYRTAEACRPWDGKLTVIAAVTPAIERAWSINRDLGERFSHVRWQNTKKPTEAARMARAQIGHEREIAAMMRARTKDVFQAALEGPAYLPEKYGPRIDASATLVAQLRRHVTRDSSAGRPIIEASSAEEPTRLAKMIGTIAAHHASLLGREEVSDLDMRPAMRAALDTIPASRLGVIQSIPGIVPMTDVEIRQLSELHRNTVAWQIDELEALGVLQIGRTLDNGRTCAYTQAFFELWEESQLW